MTNLHTETMMRLFPGLGICAMENGGMMFTEDGDYVDAIDVLGPTRDHLSIDVVSGDGDKGRMGVPDDEEMFADADTSETEEEELNRLVAEQAEDEAVTTFIKTTTSDEEESGGNLSSPHSGGTQASHEHNNEDHFPGRRTNGKGGWIARNRGHKPEYKDRRLRAAGSGKTRADRKTN